MIEQKIEENRWLGKIVDWVFGVCLVVFFLSMGYTWKTPSTKGEVFFISLSVLFSSCLWCYCPYLRRNQKYIFYFIVLSTIAIISLAVCYALLNYPPFALIWLVVVPIAFITVEQWSKIDIIEVSFQKIERMLIEGFLKRSIKLGKKAKIKREMRGKKDIRS